MREGVAAVEGKRAIVDHVGGQCPGGSTVAKVKCAGVDRVEEVTIGRHRNRSGAVFRNACIHRVGDIERSTGRSRDGVNTAVSNRRRRDHPVRAALKVGEERHTCIVRICGDGTIRFRRSSDTSVPDAEARKFSREGRGKACVLGSA